MQLNKYVKVVEGVIVEGPQLLDVSDVPEGWYLYEEIPTAYGDDYGKNIVIYKESKSVKVQVVVKHESYSKKRADAYPDVREQLDMLFHDMQAGNIPVATTFFSAIQEIKDRYPKE